MKTTFETIDKYWLREIESYADKNVKLMLLGNKCDMKREKQVDPDAALVSQDD